MEELSRLAEVIHFESKEVDWSFWSSRGEKVGCLRKRKRNHDRGSLGV
jgi:hypothetical protein